MTNSVSVQPSDIASDSTMSALGLTPTSSFVRPTYNPVGARQDELEVMAEIEHGEGFNIVDTLIREAQRR